MMLGWLRHLSNLLRCIAQGDNKGFLVARQKMATSLERLCHRFSPPFQRFLEYVITLHYKETPNYRACQALFEPLLGEPHTRPLAVDYGASACKVSHASCPSVQPCSSPCIHLLWQPLNALQS